MSAAALRIDDLLVTPSQLAGWAENERRLALVDLATWPHDASRPYPPPCPLIGIGAAGHPLSHLLDALLEPPVSLASLVHQVSQHPNAAAALVQLLRSIEQNATEAAVTLESLCYAMLQGSTEHAAWLAARPAPPPAASGLLRIQRQDDMLQLTLERPWARNAIDRAMRDRLCDAFTVAALDPDVAVVRLRSVGAAFCIGADLAEFGVTRDPATAHDIRMRTLPALALARFHGRFEVHVQGACVGAGLELAAFAQRFTADRQAWFQLPELAMGIIPGSGGCVSVPRHIGRQRAALMILSGRRIDAATALRWGLIDAIVDAPPGDEGGAHHR